jgi:ribonuclease Y
MSEKENDPEWKAVNDHVSSDVDSEGLDERRRQLNKRERELEQREQEILERREETVERKEALDEKEAELEDRIQQLRERASELEARETTLDERETEIDTKREALQEYFEQGGTDVFTYRPRVTAAFLLWTVAVVGAALAAATFLYASAPDPPLLSAPLLSEVGRLAATGVLGAAAVVELVGGFTTYYGRSWYFSVLAAVVGTVLLLPVGLAAIVMITVGESGFD